jgi:hypothetical protein
MTIYNSMLLGPPGCAQVFPYLSPGPLDFWWYAKKRKNHSRVATNTRTTECPTQPRRMIDASRVYTFILTTKCIQNWASFRAISCAKNRTRADLTSLNTSDSNSIRSSARTGDTCSLLAGRCTVLYSVDAEKRKKSWSQHGSITTAYTSIVGVSDMHMNRNRKSFFNSIRV